MSAATRAVADRAFDHFRLGMAGDRDEMEAFLDMFTDDAVLNFPKTPNTNAPYVGREAIKEFFHTTVQPVYDTGLFVTPVFALEDEQRVAYLFADKGVMRGGRDYANSVCITLEVRGEQISRYWEFFGSAGYFPEAAEGA
jgi:ketosteroid isomerase-like protein